MNLQFYHDIKFSEEIWEQYLELILKLVRRKYPNATSNTMSDPSLSDIANTDQVCLLCNCYVTFPFHSAFKHVHYHLKERNLLPFI